MKLAIVGTGLMTENTHLPWALATPGIEVQALVDPVMTRAESLARAYGIRPIIAGDVTEALREIDAAVVVTPNHTHFSVAMECINNGIAVLIEKPLATTVAEGEKIVQNAEAKGVPLLVGYCTRFQENIILLKKLLDEGYFGTVRRFIHQFGTRGGWAPLSGYNLSKTSSGGGVLVVTGSHFLDRLLYFWGQPDEVDFEDDSEGGPEANCRATFAFNGPDTSFKGVAIYSKTVSLPGMLLIETERGIITLKDKDSAPIQFHPHKHPELTHNIGRSDTSIASPYQLQYEDFLGACRDGKTPKVDGRQGLASLKLIEALYRVRRPMASDWYSQKKEGKVEDE